MCVVLFSGYFSIEKKKVSSIIISHETKNKIHKQMNVCA